MVREGYRRAAAGVVGCLLVGGTLGVPLQTPPRTISPEDAAALAAPLAGNWEPSFDDVLAQVEEPNVIALSNRLHYQYAVELIERPRLTTYTVQSGNSLWSIAQDFDTDVETLQVLNHLANPNLLRPGQEIQVARGFRGITYTVRAGDTLAGIAGTYGLPAGTIEKSNQISDTALAEGETLFLPGANPRAPRNMVASRSEAPRRATAPTPAAAAAPAPQPAQQVAVAGGWVWPIAGGLHSSEYGSRWGGWHNGLDIAVPTGTVAGAASGGTVAFAGWDGGYGYCVIIDHGNGVKTRYAHASAVLVSAGTAVNAGAPVIKVGNTGNSTGPHLHFEVIVNGTPQNPRNYLP